MNPHIHSDPIKQMVTVGLNNKLPVWTGDLAEQAAKRGLSARMQVDLGLLQQEHRGSLLPQQLGNDGQHLAYAVSNIDQVSTRPLERPTVFPYLELKRTKKLLARWGDLDPELIRAKVLLDLEE